MKQQLTAVRTFNEAFGVEQSEKHTLISDELSLLRHKLLQEEIDEYYTATAEKDLTEVLDALVDITYIVLGAVNQHGLQDVFEEAFRVVHESNMAKLGGGKRADGKISKPKNWVAPNLKQFINLK